VPVVTDTLCPPSSRVPSVHDVRAMPSASDTGDAGLTLPPPASTVQRTV
jgi:hypothetical protein